MSDLMYASRSMQFSHRRLWDSSFQYLPGGRLLQLPNTLFCLVRPWGLWFDLLDSYVGLVVLILGFSKGMLLQTIHDDRVGASISFNNMG